MIDIFTAFLPLNLPTDFSSSSLCSIEATSFRRSCPPISLFLRVIFSIDFIDEDPRPLNKISPSSDLTEPPGKSLMLLRRADIISFVEIFFAEIIEGFIITHISSSLLPAIPTPATPSSCIIFCFIFLAFENNKLCLVSPKILTLITGNLVLSLEICGSSASSGNPSIASTKSLTVLKSSSTSASGFNLIVTSEEPSELVE